MDLGRVGSFLSALKRWPRHQSPDDETYGPSRLSLKTWYFACNANALRHGFDQIQIAVLSARRSTKLRPILILDLPEPAEDLRPRLDWLARHGVEIIRHRATCHAIISDHFGPEADIFSGHWLRCDIPLLETIEDYVLYTDIDVLFRKDVALSAVKPRYLACAPEFDQDVFSYFNSGVMIMNVPALARTLRHFKDCLVANLPAIRPYEDQKVFNAAYAGRWDRLPNTWNWKPYWGFNDEAAIVHFHGPKIGMVARLIDGCREGFDDEYVRLYTINPDGYERYHEEAKHILQTSGDR